MSSRSCTATRSLAPATLRPSSLQQPTKCSWFWVPVVRAGLPPRYRAPRARASSLSHLRRIAVPEAKTTHACGDRVSRDVNQAGESLANRCRHSLRHSIIATDVDWSGPNFGCSVAEPASRAVGSPAEHHAAFVDCACVMLTAINPLNIRRQALGQHRRMPIGSRPSPS